MGAPGQELEERLKYVMNLLCNIDLLSWSSFLVSSQGNRNFMREGVFGLSQSVWSIFQLLSTPDQSIRAFDRRASFRFTPLLPRQCTITSLFRATLPGIDFD